MGSIGAGARSSQATKQAISTTPTANVASVVALSQPRVDPRARPSTTPTAPPDTSTTAIRSSCVGGPTVSESCRSDKIAARIPRGTLSQKTQCQRERMRHHGWASVILSECCRRCARIFVVRGVSESSGSLDDAPRHESSVQALGRSSGLTTTPSSESAAARLISCSE